MEDSDALSYLLRRFGEKLRSIEFKNMLSAAHISFVAAYCQNLEYVCIYGLDSCTSDQWEFLHKLPKHAIVTLFTKRAHYNGPFSTFPLCETMKSKQIYSFAEGSGEPRDHSICNEVLEMGPNVIRLNFNNTAVTQSTLLQIIKLCPRLRSLGLNGYASDAALHDLTASCPQIAHLDISRCYSVSDDGIERMAKNLNRLQSLKIPFLSELLSNLCFSFIRRHCADFLHTLYLSCTGDELSRVLYVPSLRAAHNCVPSVSMAFLKTG